MAYSEKKLNDTFLNIIQRIELGESLRAILRDKDMPSRTLFYQWLRDDKDKVDQYARATEVRADAIFDEIFEIADNSEGDDAAFVGVNRIHRHKLQIDARKWALSKMNPKKYGERLHLDANIDDKRKTIAELFPTFDEEN